LTEPSRLQLSTVPAGGPITLDDVVGRWQFYLDSASRTVIVNLRHDGSFTQQIIANRGGIQECPGGTWSLEGSLVHLTGYATVSGDNNQSRTWWMLDTPSGLALFGGDGLTEQSFVPMRRPVQKQGMATQRWFFAKLFAAITFVLGSCVLFYVGFIAFLPPPPGTYGCGNKAMAGFALMCLTPVFAGVLAIGAAIFGGMLDITLRSGNLGANTPKMARQYRWKRKVPAVMAFLLGGASCIVGTFAVAVMTYVITVQHCDNFDAIGDMCAGCFLYLGPGLAWILSSILFWKGRASMALTLTLVGILIPIVLFAMKGF
jgi:hypothetical protein